MNCLIISFQIFLKDEADLVNKKKLFLFFIMNEKKRSLPDDMPQYNMNGISQSFRLNPPER